MSNYDKVKGTAGYRILREYMGYEEPWEPGDHITEGLIDKINAAIVAGRTEEVIRARRIAAEEGDYDTQERLEDRSRELKALKTFQQTAPAADATGALKGEDDDLVVRID